MRETARSSKWSKRIAILSFMAINVGNLVLRFTTDVPQIIVVLIFFASFVPYLIHLHYVSPRLDGNVNLKKDEDN